MTATIIRVDNFRDREQCLQDAKRSQRLASLRTSAGPDWPALAERMQAAAALVDEVTLEVEAAMGKAKLDRRERAPRALCAVLRDARRAAAKLCHASMVLDGGPTKGEDHV